MYALASQVSIAIPGVSVSGDMRHTRIGDVRIVSLRGEGRAAIAIETAAMAPVICSGADGGGDFK